MHGPTCIFWANLTPFSPAQRNPQDYYAWSPSVPLGAGAAFHRPVQFGTLRLVDTAHSDGGGH
jgi:hypothetical protein